MEFDKSKVYTSLNADELKVGSKVIVADTIDELKQYVEANCDTSTIMSIMPEYFSDRFVSDEKFYNLAYLISETEKKKLKWTDLKIGDVVTKDDTISMVVEIDKAGKYNSHIRIGDSWIADSELEEWEKIEE